MKDEKYISIEYDKWEEFYKPLEDNYKKLEKELEYAKKSRRADIHVKFNSKTIKGFDDIQVGFIELSVHGPLLVDIPARDQLANMLIKDIHDSLKEKRKDYDEGTHNSSEYTKRFLKGPILLTEKEVDDATVCIVKQKIELESKIIENNEATKRFNEARKSLPWIVRKLFKIK